MKNVEIEYQKKEEKAQKERVPGMKNIDDFN